MSRRPLPDFVKKAKGTLQRCRVNDEAPEPVRGLPEPPGWLSEDAKDKFKILLSRIEKQQYASESHTEMLALAAKKLADIEKYDKHIQEHGAVYWSESPMGSSLKANPSVKLQNEAVKEARLLLQEFGLSPSSMSKVKVPNKPKAGKFDKFKQ